MAADSAHGKFALVLLLRTQIYMLVFHTYFECSVHSVCILTMYSTHIRLEIFDKVVTFSTWFVWQCGSVAADLAQGIFVCNYL